MVSFQEQALRRCVRSQRKIHSLFPKELMARRKRHYQKLRLEDHYSVMSEVLAKNKEQHSYMCFFEPQMIGEDYINGKLNFRYSYSLWISTDIQKIAGLHLFSWQRRKISDLKV